MKRIEYQLLVDQAYEDGRFAGDVKARAFAEKMGDALGNEAAKCSMLNTEERQFGMYGLMEPEDVKEDALSIALMRAGFSPDDDDNDMTRFSLDDYDIEDDLDIVDDGKDYSQKECDLACSKAYDEGFEDGYNKRVFSDTFIEAFDKAYVDYDELAEES